MLLGKVTGSVTSTVKADKLTGLKLLVVDVLGAGGSVQSAARIAPDTVGAGVGDMVILTQGSAARMAAGLGTAPVDLAIIGIVDRVNT